MSQVVHTTLGKYVRSDPLEGLLPLKKNRLVCGKPGGMYSPYCFNRTMQSGAKEDS